MNALAACLVPNACNHQADRRLLPRFLRQVSMPFRYMRDPDAKESTPQPLMPPGMRDHIRKDLDRSFEF